MRTEEASIKLATSARVEFEMRAKHSFSKQHFRSASYFATCSQRIEEDANGTTDENVKSIHRSYVTGAIISAVAGLEASINELYLEANDNNRNALRGLSDAAITLMAEYWKEIEGKSILLKYQTALLLARTEIFDTGTPPYDDANSLVRLRNVLTHYRPEWDSELKEHGKLRKRLSSKFKLNPFAPENSSLWFPHRCLGSGCAMWAVGVSRKFLTSFCEKMGIPNRL